MEAVKTMTFNYESGVSHVFNFFISEPESIMKGDRRFSNQPLVAKEHFVFTDSDGQLYHFSVEGNAIRDGTKVPAESSLG